jgi:hypothetical protein
MTGLEHGIEEGGAHDASLSANNFTCAICFELLLDPVVGEYPRGAPGGLALVQQLFLAPCSVFRIGVCAQRRCRWKAIVVIYGLLGLLAGFLGFHAFARKAEALTLVGLRCVVLCRELWS